MKSEMVLMEMDERQRLAWFMANRGTLIAVGTVWIGMIVWELTHGRMPGFLLAMVPVFALFRLGLYQFYSSKPFTGDGGDKESRLVVAGKTAATTLLLVASLLPIYSVPGFQGQETRFGYVWKLGADDVGALILPGDHLPVAAAGFWSGEAGARPDSADPGPVRRAAAGRRFGGHHPVDTPADLRIPGFVQFSDHAGNP